MTRRKIVIFVLLGSVAISAWFIYSKVRETRRETSYKAAMVPFQRDLRVGMTEEDVAQYLHSRSVHYHPVRYGGAPGITYQIDIAEEPGDWFVCESWNVYVALEFDATDHLSDIHLRRIGTCL